MLDGANRRTTLIRPPGGMVTEPGVGDTMVKPAGKSADVGVMGSEPVLTRSTVRSALGMHAPSTPKSTLAGSKRTAVFRTRMRTTSLTPGHPCEVTERTR